MLPSILARQLEKGIGDYIETTFPMTNEPFKGSIQNMLKQKDAVYHAPYVAVRLPFRVAEKMPTCFQAIHPAYLPYVHQQRAFARLTGDDGRSTLVATGTGSGKTECFLYPILEYCYQHRGERGIKALIIYPMNALASDQAKRIAELIYTSPELRGNVTAGMYVGGEGHTASRTMGEDRIITDHETMLNSAPDILLTNYKMLDYLLVRPRDALLWQDNGPETLRYIAVDELHTFDGAQGTDLACLLRRLKRRLGIYDGSLCCIGTSATMGSKETGGSILRYAEEVFGEPFETDSLITEDRLSAREFFTDTEATEFALPTAQQIRELVRLSEADDCSGFLEAAVKAWFPDFDADVRAPEGRIRLGERLMHHSFLQAVIFLTGGRYAQTSAIVEELSVRFPELRTLPDPDMALDSLYALVSHARTGKPEKLRPFLHVQVQLWMRELARLLAKVDGRQVTYELANSLNSEQAKHYLPVVNCRDCGLTGWVSFLNERRNAAIPNLDAFYTRYFGSGGVTMLFPLGEELPLPERGFRAWICPECLQVKLGERGDGCPGCGAEMIPVFIPAVTTEAGESGKKRQYRCPCCGSQNGLTLMGMRTATEISTDLSQIFISRFNDDRKILAFSDNVQDAAHRAGFFNARTWRVGLRTAMQRYCMDGGAGKSLEEFQTGFVAYWHEKMTREEFVGFFIGPNMTWMQAYEDMLENRTLADTRSARELLQWVENRVRYEILLEFGLGSRTGRTLEKCGCAALSFSVQDVEQIARAVQARVRDEFGGRSGAETGDFLHMVLVFLDQLRRSGAFDDPAFRKYIESDGEPYLLSNSHVRWLPGEQARFNRPRFPAEPLGDRFKCGFDIQWSKRYAGWVSACCPDFSAEKNNSRDICGFIFEEAVRQKVISPIPGPKNFRVYGLNRARMWISDQVVQMRCGKCGALLAVSGSLAPLWEGVPCRNPGCSGVLSPYESGADNYYGRLYRTGSLERVNAREHTGLLKRPAREQLERDFKRGREDRALWDPNVLSCTPTLEMGIDIGDLSTVILCSMPPTQSQFLQRAGRAGRRDGNSLTLAVANAKPHDLYFYTEPLEMIQGDVTPPRVFLRASAVLERQFVAFCMDSWVKKGIPEGAIPEKVGVVLKNLEARPADLFPFNFQVYVQSTLSRLLNSFLKMFDAYLDDGARKELQTFARGEGAKDSPMHIKILDAFEGLKKQQESLKKNVNTLKALRKELEDKPRDSSYEDEIKALKSEETALLNVLQELGKKNIFNFLSDEGLLPNYAFPEAGVILRAVLYRREDPDNPAPKKQYDKLSFEYSRGASSAISEFAPNNSFYADGRRLTIDQVDLTTAQVEHWRLCPNCSHAELDSEVRNRAACPQCGSPAWADAGQVRPMLKVKMVYSNMDYGKALIGDDRDERTTVFYCRQMLVDVDEDHDITSAYRMDNGDFPFGYEFVRKATLREINFGEQEENGETLCISGVEKVRKGFKICKHCGKIQPEKGKPNHTFACPTRKQPGLTGADDYENCLFLYREFQTEILRLLVPATTMASTNIRMESFVAAFMLGMKEYFGNVDHLRATVSEVPVPDADYRKQYLVIYDSVPGGTGYLKQLMHEKNALIEIFEKSLQVMENCACKDDDQKDGCYHCLYAYRQSRKIGQVSRKTAMELLRSILSGKDHVEPIRKLNDIPVNPLFDSELEACFIEAICRKAGQDLVPYVRNGKHCYYLKFPEIAWEIEPQVCLGPGDGVAVPCKPDFVFHPLSPDTAHKPVAVFTDGFTYHRDIAADDTLKREAIRRSGKYRVWSLSFKDVQSVFAPQGDYCAETLAASHMPYGTGIYQATVKQADADALQPAKRTSFELLLDYLQRPDAEKLFRTHAEAYAMSLLDPPNFRNQSEYRIWEAFVKPVKEQTHFTDLEGKFPGTMFGNWTPEGAGSHLTVHAGLSTMALKAKKMPGVCAVLKDELAHRTPKYEQAWNGFWRFFNVMQFAPEFAAVSSVGLKQMVYLALPVVRTEADTVQAQSMPDGDWKDRMELLLDEDVKAFARAVSKAGVPAPEEAGIGCDIAGEDGRVIATVEIAWPGNKIALMTGDQHDREKLEALGWKILSLSDAADADIAKQFGGDGK